MKKLTVKALLMAGIIAFSANIFADPVTTPSEEKENAKKEQFLKLNSYYFVL